MCFPNFLCPFGPTGNGQFTAIAHNGVEWEVLAYPCVTENSTIEPYMEYSPVTDKLMVYHRGGPDQGSFDYSRTLMEYNVSSWDSLTSPDFVGYFTNGKMKINPVSGDVYFYDLDQDGENFFNMFVWDGSGIEQMPDLGELDVIYQDFQLEFHPITGEPHVIYLDGSVFPGAYRVKRFDGNTWVEDYPGLGNMFLGFILDAVFDPISGDLDICGLIGDNSLKIIKGQALNSGIAQSAAPEVDIYPNPAQDQVTIDAPGLIKARVLSMSGQLILESNDQVISLSDLVPGVYFCELVGDGWKLNKRLVVE